MSLSIHLFDIEFSFVKAMCKVVAKSSEDVKQSIRRSRQKVLKTMSLVTFFC